MNEDSKNVRLTAYALNELNAADRAEFERELEAHPDWRREVEEIRATADLLTRALAGESGVELDAPRREAIRSASQRPAHRPFWWSLPALGTVAALAFAVFSLRYYETDTSRPVAGTSVQMPRQVAENLQSTTPAAAVAPTPSAPKPPAVGGRDLKAKGMAPAAPAATVKPDMAKGRRSAPIPGEQDYRRLESRELSVGLAKSGNAIMTLSTGLYDDGRERTNQMSEGDELISLPPGFLSPSQDDFPERTDQPFIRVEDHPLSTFSIDVDTASYAVARRFLNEGQLPPADAVRVEEMINYFPYDYAPPKDETPFAAHLEAAPAPWNPANTLVRIALKGREIPAQSRPPLNLVFLVDVSGSMSPDNKLPLVQRALKALVQQLDERDRIALVVYAGSSGLVLPPTSGGRGQEIIEALDRLESGGSTAGGSGIQLAYQTARANFDKKATNRVILCTDGDFNVGLTQRGDLERLIEEEAKSGVFLSVLGFGMGNYKDSTLELLADKGNGNYAYIDDFNEARKALVDQMMGTLVTIAKDVKIQVEFNPAHVAGYRLIGYENRMLKKEDFNNDKVDAGDIGAGHTVTAFYELIPAGRPVTDAPGVDPLKYGIALPEATYTKNANPEWLTVKLRYKQPDGDTSRKLEFPLMADAMGRGEASRDFQFAAAVAAFGQRLRGNKYIGEYSYDQILALASPAVGPDPYGYRAEFLKLVRNAKAATPAAK